MLRRRDRLEASVALDRREERRSTLLCSAGPSARARRVPSQYESSLRAQTAPQEAMTASKKGRQMRTEAEQGEVARRPAEGRGGHGDAHVRVRELQRELSRVRGLWLLPSGGRRGRRRDEEGEGLARIRN